MESNDEKPKKRKKDETLKADQLDRSTAHQSKFQTFTTESVHRADMKGAPYNPRKISDDAKRRLKQSLGKVGLVQPIVWNRQTGNVVGGHQRLSQLDALEGTINYTLTVAVVDVDETREKEINVLLNNTLVTGDWDYDQLKSVLNSEGLDLESTGFDVAEVMKLLGDDQHARNETLTTVAHDLDAVKQAYEDLLASGANKDDVDFYNVLVFARYEDRAEFTEMIEVEDNRYVDGSTVVKLIRSLQDRIRNLEEAQLPVEGDGGVEADGVTQNPAEPMPSEPLGV